MKAIFGTVLAPSLMLQHDPDTLEHKTSKAKDFSQMTSWLNRALKLQKCAGFFVVFFSLKTSHCSAVIKLKLDQEKVRHFANTYAVCIERVSETPQKVQSDPI